MLWLKNKFQRFGIKGNPKEFPLIPKIAILIFAKIQDGDHYLSVLLTCF